MKLLMKEADPAIVTHDMRLIEDARHLAGEKGIAKERFEFQMLLGIKRSVQKRLADEGYRMRVYIPYGTAWPPYMVRRLRERRENLLFVLKNIVD